MASEIYFLVFTEFSEAYRQEHLNEWHARLFGLKFSDFTGDIRNKGKFFISSYRMYAGRLLGLSNANWTVSVIHHADPPPFRELHPRNRGPS